MPFALFKTDHPVGFSADEKKLLEAACKKAWKSMGADFAGKFEEDDVGGVTVSLDQEVGYLRWTTVEFVYVDRGAQFTVALREALRKEFASVVQTPPLINMCPTSAECWFTDPTWAVREKDTAPQKQVVDEEHPEKHSFVDLDIAREAHSTYWEGRFFGSDLRNETFEAQHPGFFEKLVFIGKKSWKKHWETCAPCRTALGQLCADRDLFVKTLLQIPSPMLGFKCEMLKQVSPQTPEAIALHIESCEYCKRVVDGAIEAIQKLLSGEDTA